MRPAVLVGNDVIDRSHPRARDRTHRSRFLERVCTSEERHVIGVADDAERELWCHWTAKETAYKVVSKMLGAPPPFVHSSFRVEWSAIGPTGSSQELVAPVRRGLVRHRTEDSAGAVRDVVVPVRIHETGSLLHCVGHFGEPGVGGTRPAGMSTGTARLDPRERGAGVDELREHFTDREIDAVHSRASARVRLAARAELAAVLGCADRRIEVVCAPGTTGRRPPYVLVDGERCEADVSLSHHGGWIGWAIWVAAQAMAEAADAGH